MEEIDLKEIFLMFWKKKVQIILLILIFMVIGIIYSVGFVTPMYSSSTTLVLAGTESSSSTNTTGADSITTSDITINSKLVATYSELVKSKNVLRQVISNLGINVDEANLRQNVSVSSVKDTEIIEITVSNENAGYSAKIANEIAKVFTEKVGEIYNINNVHVVDEAEVSSSPSNVNHAKDIVIFAFIGAVIAIMYVLIANMLDTTVKTQEDIESSIKLPVLASIPIYDYDMQKLKKRKGGRR